ncbi:MAG: hypothetical protein V7L04_25110 [Nostoc sp.]|uniref:hypothetical protein n=1 Tax=Nostoc sp. TaxID=1180 RepID=UPI002FFA169C
MGYGFTFVAFQSEYLQIESTKNGRKASRTYKNLYKFIYSASDIPNSEEEDLDYQAQEVSEKNGTKITIKFPLIFPDEVIEESLSATFRIAKSNETIKAVLITQSIIGILDTVFKSGSCFEFILKTSGRPVLIETGYLTVRQVVKSVLNSEVQFYDRPNQYEKFVEATENLPIHTKEQARKVIVLDEIIDNVKIGIKNPLYARILISATSKSHINQYNEKFRNEDSISYDFALEHGLWLAICGMPTSVCLHPFDHSNYLPYTVIVDIKDTSIRKELDAGRKGISAYRMKQISDQVFELLKQRNFIKYRGYIVGAISNNGRGNDPLYDPKQELYHIFKDKKWFNSILTQKYFPPLEEQEVISLFVELVSQKTLRGYYLKILSGYQVYDGLYEYQLEQNNETEYSDKNYLGIYKNIFNANGGSLKKEILIEFKQELSDIYKDINSNRKNISHIDILVVWDVKFKDKENLQKDKGDILTQKDITANVFYGVTHQLLAGSRQHPLPIIELKKILELVFNYQG